MTESITIRAFTPADIAAVWDLQMAYARENAGAIVIPGEYYLSPSFHGGEDVLCALDAQGRLVGYAPLFASLVQGENDLPHTLWTEIKGAPAQAGLEQIKDALLERVRGRARELAAQAPGHPARLAFQYDRRETASRAYVEARGARYSESVFSMRRRLDEALPELPAPVGVDVRAWRMESEAEQRAYVAARNEAFPEAPLALEDWQYFMLSPMWAVGAVMTAFDGAGVAGCVAVYWEEEEIERLGRKAGHTEFIFVRQAWRGRGIAAYLIAEGLRYLKARGMEEALLDVRATNAEALRLYRKLGYEMVAESQIFTIPV